MTDNIDKFSTLFPNIDRDVIESIIDDCESNENHVLDILLELNKNCIPDKLVPTDKLVPMDTTNGEVHIPKSTSILKYFKRNTYHKFDE